MDKHQTCSALKICWIVILLLLPVSFALSQEADAVADELKKLRVLSKFLDLEKANKLLYSLKKSGQDVRIIEKQKEIVLKAISFGAYKSRKKAESIIRRLQQNDVDAFIHKTKSGRYRIHAGALQDEIYYWSRYEKLVSLGYKKLQTTLKPVEVTEYLIVRDKSEELKPPMQLQPVVSKIINQDIVTEFYAARFKGEFSIWGTQEDRSSSNYFNAAVSARTRHSNVWDMTYGARFEMIEQSSDENLQDFSIIWEPTYFNFYQNGQRWQLGLIDARWKQQNKDNLSERMFSKNLSRYKLDDNFDDRRRPTFGLSWQFKQVNQSLDVIWIPLFRPAKLPDFGSIWHPVSRTNKAIMGIESTADWESLVENGSFADEEILSGGVGVRLSRFVGSNERAITLQYVRRSEPYYKLNPSIQNLLAQDRTLDFAVAFSPGYTFTPEHPYSGILSWEEIGKISHIEVALLSNRPYTKSNYQMKTAASLEWKLGFNYPKTNKNTHLAVFFSGWHINTSNEILDQKTRLALSGNLFMNTSNQYWKFGSDFDIALNQFDVFINPKIIFQQSKHVNIYLNYQIFAGDDNTNNGYHTKHSIVSLAWQAIF